MSAAYAWWKTVHVLSATILFGTGLGTAFFCWFGYRSALRSDDIAGLRRGMVPRRRQRHEHCDRNDPHDAEGSETHTASNQLKVTQTDAHELGPLVGRIK